MAQQITSTGTPINAGALRARGYREYPPNTMIDRFDRLFQRAVYDEQGILYFLNFREWIHEDETSWDAQLACDTDTRGYLWATIKEQSIERAEERMAALWQVSGSIRYE